ncbi:MAG: glycoside hydrolase family 32 protein [Chitinophagaceae bacterium]|nr:glycoside hydrolase family 32 protein [Chitinophagaceae bacterium]
MRVFLFLYLSWFSLASFAQDLVFYKEKYRPQFHFTPAIHWMNDPNGLVYHKGEYHLFYQFNPMGNRWGHMSWGHAVSKDLVHWQHLPVAIPEEKDTMIFSGTCVSDIHNTSGFAKTPGITPLVAIYTAHIENVSQTQHLAYSLDDGRTWIKYNRNPILDIGSKEFRDPQVFWYEPQKKWVMCVVLATDKKVRFYSSANLIQWQPLSDFGPAGDVNGVWECPDLFEVPVEGEPRKTKWVLMHSPAPYMQYFVGEFDGAAFKTGKATDKIFRPDYGPDYYAAITYKNLPVRSPVTSIGWVNNWNYANDIPTSPWKSAMSLPRKLSVKKINTEWVLLQQPVEAIRSLREKQLVQLKGQTISGVKRLPVSTRQCELNITIQPSDGANCGVRLAAGNGHEIEIGYNTVTQTLYIDRSKTAHRSFHANFEKLTRYETAVPLNNKTLTLSVLFDQSIVEVFANNGEAVLTAQLFPDEKDNGIEIFSHKGSSGIVSLRVWKMKSIW